MFNPITLHHVAGPHTLCLGSSTDPSFWLPNGPRGKQWDGAYVKIKDAANCVENQLEFMYNAGDLDEAEPYWWFYPQNNAVWALEVQPDPDLGTVVSLNRMDHVWAEDGWPADAEDVQVLAALPDWTSLIEPPDLVRPPARDAGARKAAFTVKKSVASVFVQRVRRRARGLFIIMTATKPTTSEPAAITAREHQNRCIELAQPQQTHPIPIGIQAYPARAPPSSPSRAALLHQPAPGE